MNENWTHWFQNNFDKLLLVFLYVGLLTMVILMIRWQTPETQVAWIREAAGTILGALLGLITGATLRRSAASDIDSSATIKPPNKDGATTTGK